MGTKILVVDDSQDSRLLLVRFLKKAGYKDIVTADSAKMALDLIQGKDFDLILTDLVMPEMDGIELCKIIRKDSGMLDIPIIMVTSASEMDYLKQAFETGALDYITKPVKKIELLARVKTALKLKEEMDRRKKREQELKELAEKLEVANERLKRLSSLDGLTGIANRRIFDETLQREWNRAIREQSVISLIMLDVDNFKLYNDTYGHLMGDECLKSVASVIAERLKRSVDLPARYGGEEFACILPGTEKDGAFYVAESIRESVKNQKIPHKKSTKKIVTVSIGVATTIPKKNTNPIELINKADSALYKAKSTGRDKTCVYDEKEADL